MVFVPVCRGTTIQRCLYHVVASVRRRAFLLFWGFGNTHPTIFSDFYAFCIFLPYKVENSTFPDSSSRRDLIGNFQFGNYIFLTDRLGELILSAVDRQNLVALHFSEKWCALEFWPVLGSLWTSFPDPFSFDFSNSFAFRIILKLEPVVFNYLVRSRFVSVHGLPHFHLIVSFGRFDPRTQSCL